MSRRNRAKCRVPDLIIMGVKMAITTNARNKSKKTPMTCPIETPFVMIATPNGASQKGHHKNSVMVYK